MTKKNRMTGHPDPPLLRGGRPSLPPPRAVSHKEHAGGVSECRYQALGPFPTLNEVVRLPQRSGRYFTDSTFAG